MAGERECGPCSMCCRLLPVAQLDKPADQWCVHARPGRGGCAIYADRPPACRSFSCLWLTSPETLPDEELRPDRCHAVFDPRHDKIEVGPPGQRRMVSVLLVWVDGRYPDAHRAPLLRRVMEAAAEQARTPTIVRIGKRGLLILAPCLSRAGRWEEIDTNFDAALGAWEDRNLAPKA